MRKGQHQFRKNIIKGAKRCEATLSELIDLCESCHIKPYSLCEEEEKLDPNNAILFLASIHKAFDKGYISFNKNGKILLSSELSDWEVQSLGLTGNERIRMPGLRPKYMKYHRENIFKK